MKFCSWFFLLLLISSPSFAVPPLVAGNGFNCVKSQNTVNCKGNFPGVPGTFTASGLGNVNIVYDTENFPGHRYIFDSTTGCLMRIDFDGKGKPIAAVVSNSAGIQKEYRMPAQQAEAYRFCQGK